MARTKTDPDKPLGYWLAYYGNLDDGRRTIAQIDRDKQEKEPQP